MKKLFFSRVIAILLLLAVLFSFGACIDGDTTSPEAADVRARAELLYYLETYASFPLPEDFDPTDKSVIDICLATGDPYIYYFDAETYNAYSADLQGNLVGIGVAITEHREGDAATGIYLLSVFPGSPAETAGLRPHDIITAVDGVAVTDAGYETVCNKVAGDAGTTVSITYLRNGNIQTVEITRALCTKQTVYSRVIPMGSTKIGYVYITDFDAVTLSQFVKAVSSLESSGVDRMIFDLRGNGGGYLDTVCEMLAYVLPDGDICHIDYGYEEFEDYTISSKNNQILNLDGKDTPAVTPTLADGTPLDVAHDLADMPIGLLIDDYTASAAELFVSALRDYRDAGLMDVTIAGTDSYGKGCMQQTMPLSNGDWLKLTVALYNPPSNVNYDGIGITPDDGGEVTEPPTTAKSRHFNDIGDLAVLDPALHCILSILTSLKAN